MTTQFYSLREIGRRLQIPPSSVVYYKDRFERFIPHAGGGKRKRYPVDALPVFKEIRAMFEKNWSAEQIEQTLARQFHAVLHDLESDAPEPETDVPAPEFVHSMTGVLEKVSGLLENQSLFRAEIDALRREIVSLKQEKQDLDNRYRQTIAQMETHIQELKRERNDVLSQILARLNMRPHADNTPPEAFLDLPLVIRSEHNEYLGVAGKTRHFSLREFINIIRKNQVAVKDMELSWQRAGSAWILHIAARKTASGERHAHELEVAETLTPAKNHVVQLTRLVIDGNAVPDPFLLVLFRKIKDGFDD